jgi:hypothetical protein
MKVDLCVRAVREPEKSIKKDNNVIFHVLCEGGTAKGGELKLGTFVEHMDIINHANFYLCLMNIFRDNGVKNKDLPLNGKWLLRHCLALPR